jgi:hypothetical protein
VSRLPDLDDFLDPKTLTPQGLYRLQSDTWAQGADYERERILKLLENPYFHNIQSPDIHIECEMCKTIELIKGEQK